MTSIVTSGQLSASTPKITLARPLSAAATRWSAVPHTAEMIRAAPPTIMLMPTTMASAKIVIPGHASTTIPATSQPTPAAAVIAGDGGNRADARSINPVTNSAAATSAGSTDNEVNGRVTSTTPTTTHASPTTSDRHPPGNCRKNARSALMTACLSSACRQAHSQRTPAILPGIVPPAMPSQTTVRIRKWCGGERVTSHLPGQPQTGSQDFRQKPPHVAIPGIYAE